MDDSIDLTSVLMNAEFIDLSSQEEIRHEERRREELWERIRRLMEREKWLDCVRHLDGEMERRMVMEIFKCAVEEERSEERSLDLLNSYWLFLNEFWNEKELLDVFRRLVENKETEAADRFIDLATPRVKKKLKEYFRCCEESKELLIYIRCLEGKRNRKKLLDFIRENSEDHDKALELEGDRKRKLLNVFRRLIFQKESIETMYEVTTLATDKEMLLLLDYVRRLAVMMEKKKEKKILLMLRKAICLHRMSKGSDLLVITLQELVGMHHGPGPPLDSVTRIQGSKFWVMECDVWVDLLFTCRWSNPRIHCKRCGEERDAIPTLCGHVVCCLCTILKWSSKDKPHRPCLECGQEVIIPDDIQLGEKRAHPDEDEDEEVPSSKRTCPENPSAEFMRNFSEEIVDSLSQEPRVMALRFLKASFITEDVLKSISEENKTKADKATILYTSVLGVVKEDPHKIKQFVAALQKSPAHFHKDLVLLYEDFLVKNCT